jgi:hypothetical protein
MGVKSFTVRSKMRFQERATQRGYRPRSKGLFVFVIRGPAVDWLLKEIEVDWERTLNSRSLRFQNSGVYIL